MLLILLYTALWALLLITGIDVRHPAGLLFLIPLCYLAFHTGWPVPAPGQKELSRPQPLRMIAVSAAAAAFASLCVICFRPRLTARYTSALFQTLNLSVLWCGCLSLVILCLFRFPKPRFPDFPRRIAPRTAFFGTLLLCLLAWMPMFLFEYPGIVSADSLVQLEQITGLSPWSNHHPVIHTFLMGVCYRTGVLLFGTSNAGVACYTLLQMVFLSLCCAASIRMLALILPPERHWLIPASALFFAIVPFHAVFSVILWKDIPFAGIMLLLTAHLTGMCLLRPRGITLRDYFILAFLGCCMCLFRTNGFFAFLASAPFLILAFSGHRKQIFLSCLGALLIAAFARGPMMNTFGIQQPDTVESLSVPLQQIARVLVDAEAGSCPPVDTASMQLIEEVIDTTYISALYAPDFADNIKELVRAGRPELLSLQPGRFLRLWLHLLRTHPGSYIRAYLDLMRGYWDPGDLQQIAWIDGVIDNRLGLFHSPLLSGPYVRIKEIWLKLGETLPVYGLLWNTAFYCWSTVIITVVLLCQRKRTWVVPIPGLMLLATLYIATPVASFRYIYCLVCCMPLLTGCCIDKRGTPA